jgi:iron complex outermembrane receptor protein
MPSHRPSHGLNRCSKVFASCLLLTAIGTLALPTARPVQAQVLAAGNLADLTLEQLSNIEVTLATRRAQPLSDVPASAYVISSEDIRRSGATSLPEARRLAPTLQVARADANQYAISARGFNNVLANKMLVMIDGRVVYSPLFSGVFWEAQGVMLEDVDRIEVVSGPGGTLWGTNAMNGVINVVTRSAEETQGPLIAAGAGNHDTVVSARIGVAPGSAGHLRVYGQFSSRDDTERSDNFDLPDASDRLQAGFRGDWGDASAAMTLQGDLYRGNITQPAATPSRHDPRRLRRERSGSWTRSYKSGSQLRAQGYFDYTEREQPGSLNESLQSWDIQGQHSFRPASKHDVVWGLEYRYQADRTASLTPFLGFLPPDRDLRTTSLFAQDAVKPRRVRDVGVRLGGTVTCTPAERSAASLATRGSMAASRGGLHPASIAKSSPVTAPHSRSPGPARSEANVLEPGYRDRRPRPLVLVDRVLSRLPACARSQPLTARERDRGTNTGVEIWGSYRASTAWRFTAGWVQQSIDLDVAAGHSALGGTGTLGNDPKSWGQLRSTLGLGDLDLDAAVRYVGRLPEPEVPSYATLDARVGWHFKKDFEVSLSGWNLTGGSHPEWGLAGARPEYERSVFFKIMMGS